MPSISSLVQIFLVGFGLNLIWEFAHCYLYETCRRQTWRQNVPLLITMSLKDAFFIVVFYLLSTSVWRVDSIVERPVALITFSLIALSFSFIDETVSLKRGRWEYATAMPMLFGVGVTPLLEIAVTGLATFFLVF